MKGAGRTDDEAGHKYMNSTILATGHAKPGHATFTCMLIRYLSTYIFALYIKRVREHYIAEFMRKAIVSVH